MRHQMINTLRDEKRAILRHLSHHNSQSDSQTSIEEAPVLSEYGVVVLNGLLQLSTERRLVFILRAENNLTDDEIGSQLQISSYTAKNQYYHACRFLRDYLRQHAGTEAMIAGLAAFSN